MSARNLIDGSFGIGPGAEDGFTWRKDKRRTSKSATELKLQSKDRQETARSWKCSVPGCNATVFAKFKDGSDGGVLAELYRITLHSYHDHRSEQSSSLIVTKNDKKSVSFDDSISIAQDLIKKKLGTDKITLDQLKWIHQVIADPTKYKMSFAAYVGLVKYFGNKNSKVLALEHKNKIIEGLIDEENPSATEQPLYPDYFIIRNTKDNRTTISLWKKCKKEYDSDESDIETESETETTPKRVSIKDKSISKEVIALEEANSKLDSFHLVYGHGSATMMYRQIKDIVYGITKRMVKCWVSGCIQCSQRNILRKVAGKKTPLHPIKSTFFNHILQIDLTEQLITDPRDNSTQNLILLNIICHFTKFASSSILPDKTAVSVLTSLSNHCALFGHPIILQNDNGGEFENELIERWCLAYGIKHVHSRPHHPQSQGCVEKFNGILGVLLNTILADPRYTELINACRIHTNGMLESRMILDIAIKQYNNRIHGSTGLEPDNMVFGRKRDKHPLLASERAKYVLDLFRESNSPNLDQELSMVVGGETGPATRVVGGESSPGYRMMVGESGLYIGDDKSMIAAVQDSIQAEQESERTSRRSRYSYLSDFTLTPEERKAKQDQVYKDLHREIVDSAIAACKNPTAWMSDVHLYELIRQLNIITLNDEAVINAKQGVYVMATFSFHAAMAMNSNNLDRIRPPRDVFGGYLPYRLYDYETVWRKWSRFSNTDLYKFKFWDSFINKLVNILVFPINISNFHWVMCTVNFDTKTLRWFDSMSRVSNMLIYNNSMSIAEKQCELFMEIIHHLERARETKIGVERDSFYEHFDSKWKQSWKTEYDWKDPGPRSPRLFFEQLNGHNCGDFVMLGCRSITKISKCSYSNIDLEDLSMISLVPNVDERMLRVRDMIRIQREDLAMALNYQRDTIIAELEGANTEATEMNDVVAPGDARIMLDQNYRESLGLVIASRDKSMKLIRRQARETSKNMQKKMKEMFDKNISYQRVEVQLLDIVLYLFISAIKTLKEKTLLTSVGKRAIKCVYGIVVKMNLDTNTIDILTPFGRLVNVSPTELYIAKQNLPPNHPIERELKNLHKVNASVIPHVAPETLWFFVNNPVAMPALPPERYAIADMAPISTDYIGVTETQMVELATDDTSPTDSPTVPDTDITMKMDSKPAADVVDLTMSNSQPAISPPKAKLKVLKPKIGSKKRAKPFLGGIDKDKKSKKMKMTASLNALNNKSKTQVQSKIDDHGITKGFVPPRKLRSTQS